MKRGEPEFRFPKYHDAAHCDEKRGMQAVVWTLYGAVCAIAFFIAFEVIKMSFT